MKKVDIIRAWKDEGFRQTLTAEQITQLPANPAGILSEEAQNMVSGGICHSGVAHCRGENVSECYPN